MPLAIQAKLLRVLESQRFVRLGDVRERSVDVRLVAARRTRHGASAAASPAFRPIEDELRELERTRMLQALAAAGGVHRRAAELIGMPRRTFATQFKLYELASMTVAQRSG